MARIPTQPEWRVQSVVSGAPAKQPAIAIRNGSVGEAGSPSGGICSTRRYYPVAASGSLWTSASRSPGRSTQYSGITARA